MLTPEEARKAAKIELGKVAKDSNPARERKEDREAPNMRAFADDYMERHATPNKRPGPAREDRSMLDRIVLPKLGSRKVKDVSRRDSYACSCGFQCATRSRMACGDSYWSARILR